MTDNVTPDVSKSVMSAGHIQHSGATAVRKTYGQCHFPDQYVGLVTVLSVRQHA